MGLLEPTGPQFLRYQFVRADDVLSDLIAVAGAGDFSHVDLLLDDDTLLGARHDAVGGKPPGVQIRTRNYASWSKQVIIAVPCTTLQKATALNFATAQIGRPYDIVAILGFVAGRNWRDPAAWFCSELGAATGEHGGLWPQLYSPANKIEPVPLSLVCSAVQGRQILVIK